MAAPTVYNRAYNFANLQSVDPSSPLNGSYVEVELNRIKAALDSLSNNIQIIQRADTALANASVGYDQLKAELDGFGFNPPETWATATNYVVRDTTFENGGFYRCLVSHTSSVFATDLAAGYWELVADFTTAPGAMAEAIYDPNSVNDDVFDMDNMVDGTSKKAMTAAERAKLAYLTVTGAVDLDAAATKLGYLTLTQAVDLDQLETDFNALVAGVSASYDTLAEIETALGTKLEATDTITDAAAFFIEIPDNQDYRLVVDIPFAGTITKVTTRSASGTCTATVKINTTALGGTANSVSTTENGQAHSTSNTFAAGDDIVLTLSSNSSCLDMSVTIKFTRALS